MMDVQAKKKRKCSPFSAEDQLRLVNIIEKEKGVVENKTTNKVANEEKEQAWQRIAAAFNAGAASHRSVEQLRAKFDNLKTKARKIVAEQRHFLKGTGGGPGAGSELDAIVESTLRIINIKTVVGFDNPMDCDNNTPIIILGENSIVEGDIVSAGSGETVEIENILFAEPGPSHLNQSDEQTKIAAATPSTWCSYTPRKLKQPASKKLRPAVINPVVLAKEKYYKKKLRT